MLASVILKKGEILKEKNEENRVPADMFILLAENAKAVNIYAGMEFAGQQLLMERFAKADSENEKRKLIEDLTR